VWAEGCEKRTVGTWLAAAFFEQLTFVAHVRVVIPFFLVSMGKEVFFDSRRRRLGAQ